MTWKGHTVSDIVRVVRRASDMVEHALREALPRNRSFHSVIRDHPEYAVMVDGNPPMEGGRVQVWKIGVGRIKSGSLRKFIHTQYEDGHGKCPLYDKCPARALMSEQDLMKADLLRCRVRWMDVCDCPEGPAEDLDSLSELPESRQALSYREDLSPCDSR